MSIRQVILSFIFLFLFTWLFVLLIPVAAKDHRMIAAFDSDESLCIEIIGSSLAVDKPIKQTVYGDLYFNISKQVLHVLYKNQPITSHEIILILRSVSAFFAFICFVLLFFLSRTYTNNFWLPWLVIYLTLGAYTTLFLTGINAHPDTVQLAFILGSLYLLQLCINHASVWLFLCSFIMSGLAFSAKFHGIFLFPIQGLVFLYLVFKNKLIRNSFIEILGLLSLLYMWYFSFPSHLMKDIDVEHEHYLQLKNIVSFFHGFITLTTIVSIGLWLMRFVAKLKEIALKTYYVISTLSLGFLLAIFAIKVSSPEMSKNLNFMLVLFDFMDIITLGHWFQGDFTFVNWVSMLTQEGIGHPILVLLGIIFFIYHLMKRSIPKYGLIWLWVLFNLIYVLVRVRAGFEHYLITFMPLFWLLVVHEMQEYLKEKNHFLYGLSFSVAILIFMQGFRFTVFKRKEFTQRVNDSRLKLGAWLLNQHPVNDKVMADYYVYVPSEFTNYKESWGMDSSSVFSYDPDLIILSRLSSRFYDSSRADKFLRGEAKDFMAKNKFYDQLHKGLYPYKLIFELEEIKVFKKYTY